MAKRRNKIQNEVLAALRRCDGSLSAYRILEELQESNPKLAPPTIYRALASLTECGQVHRLESLNAYFACQHGPHQNASILSICDECGVVDEKVEPDVFKKLSSVIGKSGFSPMRHVIEVHGHCATCTARRATV